MKLIILFCIILMINVKAIFAIPFLDSLGLGLAANVSYEDLLAKDARMLHIDLSASKFGFNHGIKRILNFSNLIFVNLV